MQDGHLGEAEGEHIEEVRGVGGLYRSGEDDLVRDLERDSVAFQTSFTNLLKAQDLIGGQG